MGYVHAGGGRGDDAASALHQEPVRACMGGGEEADVGGEEACSLEGEQRCRARADEAKAYPSGCRADQLLGTAAQGDGVVVSDGRRAIGGEREGFGFGKKK